MLSSYCTVCSQPFTALVMGRCTDCYYEDLEMLGELAMLTENLSTATEQYTYAGEAVYVTFYRMVKQGGELVAQRNERQWCMLLDYQEGFPCPPRIDFVSPYNLDDDNPIWWPKTRFFMDPVLKTVDLDGLNARNALHMGRERGRIDRMRVMSQDDFELTRRARAGMSYQQYVTDYMQERRLLQDGTNREVYAKFGLWKPDYYVRKVATNILPP